MVPEGGLRNEFHGTGGLVILGNRRRSPARIRKVDEFLQVGQPFTLDPGLAALTGLSRRRGRIERGIQPQPGDEGNGLSQGLAEVEQVQDGVAAVGHQHQGPVG